MEAQSEWWKLFYSGRLRNVQLLQQFWTPEQTEADADLIEQLLCLSSQASVLDVPCGEGRLSRALAARGYRLTGVDITAAHLDEARQQATAQQLSIQWEQRDMRDLPWEDAFDAAFCFWGSFGYFDDEGNETFLRVVFRALRPGARFLLETHIAVPEFSRHSRFRFALEEVRRFPTALYLAPQPAAPFKELTRAVAERYPETPPYGGAFATVVPHLTIAQVGEPQQLEQISDKFARASRGRLPIHSDVDKVWLLEKHEGRWKPRCSFAFNIAPGLRVPVN